MLPLNNIKVLIPRPVGQATEFADKLVKLGATPIVFPLIRVEAINKGKLKTTYQNDTFDWIIFTSSVAVEFFFNTIKKSINTGGYLFLLLIKASFSINE